MSARLPRIGAAILAAALLAGACRASPDPGPSAAPATTSTSATADTTASSAGRATTSTRATPRSAPGTTREPTSGTTVDDAVLSAKGGAIGHDESFPELGHPGYDVQHYDLDLTFDPERGELHGVEQIDLRAVDAIDDVVLDLRDLEVRKVEVDGAEVDATAADATLAVPFDERAEPGDERRIRIEYDGRPAPVPTDALGGVEVGWHSGDAGSVVMSEPEGASTWFAVNNHPLDKATYTISVTVPRPLVALSNGVLERTDDHDDDRTFHWRMDQPMANYLATVVTGDLEEVRGRTIDGVDYDSWVPNGFDPSSIEDGHQDVAALAEKLGPFPFDTYGTVVYTEDFVTGSPETRDFIGGVALEVQGRSLYAESATVGRTYTHETAHQWMGDNVSLTDWSRDIWWIEGFARFAESAIAAGDRELKASAFEDAVRSCGDQTAGDIPREELFSARSYSCGALVFWALYREVGEETFWSILREFNTRYRHANASTDDLVATASDVAGRDLKDFFDEWLFSTDRPAVPR